MRHLVQHIVEAGGDVIIDADRGEVLVSTVDLCPFRLPKLVAVERAFGLSDEVNASA